MSKAKIITDGTVQGTTLWINGVDVSDQATVLPIRITPDRVRVIAVVELLDPEVVMGAVETEVIGG